MMVAVARTALGGAAWLINCDLGAPPVWLLSCGNGVREDRCVFGAREVDLYGVRAGAPSPPGPPLSGI